MPQLTPGGKWVFGWASAGLDRTLHIPRKAWDEYGFRPGMEVCFLRGSATSGGFCLAIADTLPGALQARVIAATLLGSSSTVRIPERIVIEPTVRLLAVRGSGHALAFLSRGPIYERASAHRLMASVADPE